MTHRRTTASGSPQSGGARILTPEALVTFLSDAYWASEQTGTVGGLLLVHVSGSARDVGLEELEHAAYLIAQLARQGDAAGQVDEATIALVLKTLRSRADAQVMMERIQDFVGGSAFGWSLALGMSVFPLCGPTPQDAWSAARRDLRGAQNHETWEHIIPLDTLRTRAVSGGSLF